MAITIKYVKAKESAPVASAVVWPSVGPQGKGGSVANGKAEVFAAAFSKKKKSNVEDYPPWESPPDYTILDALKDFATGNAKGKELWLVSVSGEGQFKVISFDVATRRCQLDGPKGLRIKPVISERETLLYSPFWK